MKKLLLLLFLIPNLATGETVSYICSDYAEGSPFFSPESNNFTTDPQISEWTSYPEGTLLIEIDHEEETITTKSYSGKTEFQDVYKLITPAKKKYYIDSHISGYLLKTHDKCANDYIHRDKNIEMAKKHKTKPLKSPMSDYCKHMKNSPRAIAQTILFNLKEMRFIKSWLLEGERLDNNDDRKLQLTSQINYGSCRLE